VLGGSVVRRLLIVGLAALLAAPAFLIQPASAAVLFSCDSITGSAVIEPGLVHDPRPQSLSTGPTAPAGPADVRLVSTNAAGVKANGGALGGSISADGRFVAFGTSSTNLDPADTDGFFIADIYVKDLTTGDLTLASTSDTGVKGNDNSWAPSMSPDGTRVAFWSEANNLDPADTDFIQDLYVKNLVTGDLTLASTSDTGIKGNGESSSGALSADNAKVVFTSSATNLDPADTDTYDDVYVKNLNTGNIDLVSRSATGVKGNGRSFGGWLSADGHMVGFSSYANNLHPGDTDTVGDAYIKDRKTGALTLVSTSDTGMKGNGESFGTALSADLTKAAFSTRATNFDPRDASGTVADVYVKDLMTGDLTLASTSVTGVKGNNNSYLTAFSPDGTKVVFFGDGGLDPVSTNGYPDGYMKDLVSGGITLVTASDTGVDVNGYRTGPDSASADFTRVAFTTDGNNLDPADPDVNYDIYVKEMPAVPTSVAIAGCTNGQSGTVSIVDIRSYPTRPLGCPASLGGAVDNDYPDTTPILLGPNPRFEIDWATGPNSYGVAAVNAGPTPTQWRVRFAITASPGHDTPATNQYLPAAGSGFTKTRLQGKLDWSALDSFNCTTGIDDPLSWLKLANSGSWVAKTG
jgi:hypothetical protein